MCPVGDDQKQHLELTRDIAQKFNNDFGAEVFPIPEPLIFGAATRVMSLRDGRRKMSKSDASDMTRINMTDEADAIARKVRKARTDPDPLPGPDVLDDSGRVRPEAEDARPEAFNLLGIHAALSDRALGDVLEEFEGQPFSVFKAALTDLAVAVLGPIGGEMKRISNDPGYVDSVLRKGAENARAIAEPVLAEVHDVVGLLRP